MRVAMEYLWIKGSHERGSVTSTTNVTLDVRTGVLWTRDSIGTIEGL
jgi:hypothetical protein